MSKKINAYVSRYVIPFCFKDKKGEYENIVQYFRDNSQLPVFENPDNPQKEDQKKKNKFGVPNDLKWQEIGFWENKNKNSGLFSEMDTFSFLLNSLKEDGKGTNLGTSFVLGSNERMMTLKFEENKSYSFDFYLNGLGFVIFRSGIGFIWYDVALPEKKANINVEQYIAFQNCFKELARSKNLKIKRKVGFDKKTKEDITEDFKMGLWIAELLNAKKLDIQFWAERKHEKDNEEIVLIPDKALLFQYLYVGNMEREERIDLAFHVANGYDEKYKTPISIDKQIYEPFDDACFLVSKSGMSYVVARNYSAKEFFERQFKGKYLTDYFYIYILLLYQTYSCAHYSELLANLPANIEYANLDYLDLLEKLDIQINLFLAKSTYEVVSNVQHQNGAYVYGKEVLRIKEDMHSLTMGLEALRDIASEKQKAREKLKKEAQEKKEQLEKEAQEKKEQLEKEAQEKKEKLEKEAQEKKEKLEKEAQEYQDRKLNKILATFGCLVIVSVLIDGINLIDRFCKYSGSELNWPHVSFILGIILATVYMIQGLVDFKINKPSDTEIENGNDC